MTKVLIVEDEAGIREGLTTAIERLGHKAIAAAGLAEARRVIGAEALDCILLDMRLRDGNGLDLLRELHESDKRDVPVIVATAYGDSERTIQAMRDGAFEYLTKPFNLPLLLATVERAVKQRATLKGLAPQTAPAKQAATLVGTSTAMLGIWKIIGRAAASDAPVLITGETGTGKELVARAIHDYSPRAKRPFVAVNLAALSPGLLESELFGHEKGAFTGAAGRRAGRIEAAEDGTLLLDEIGDLELSLQTKLLRVLQDGSFERVGSTESLASRARVIAATNKPVKPGSTQSVLREDLYYRLAVIEIEVPALRARRSDIPLLVAHALEGTAARAVSEDAMEHLLRYDWPGNVRELVHVLQRASVLCGGEVIDTAHLPPGLLGAEPRTSVVGDDYESMPYRAAIGALERRLILKALERAGGNRAEAARQLGMARAQLYAKMDEHGIAGKGDRAPKSQSEK
jgi:DNA-binding NtrC family response regulator